ncbi:hypothetical protein THRCLA_22983 [Thraustotheca clavata]|uniref:Uncharacterized protein n=1 Tax=Thraustotheca clavata TaxID=74557 RepID=A0A1V9YK04_9STRA|nr:hypothetical protein THRCLA_22983 [Thraustotheca clavata]
MYGVTESYQRLFLFYFLKVPFEIIPQFIYLLIGHKRAVYFQSNFNRIQLPTLFALVFFAIAELCYPQATDFLLISGIAVNFILWALSFQYLEVHNTAG